MANRVANAVNGKTNAKASSEDGGKNYGIDKSTRRVAPSADDAALALQIAEVQKSGLSEAAKAAAIAGMKQSGANCCVMQVARAQVEGRRDLIEVSDTDGTFMPKMLSPTLVRTIAENAKFILQSLASYGL
jgi:hypothetical protein